jgi:glycosyltransferase involved in cell wall biosynthesis
MACGCPLVVSNDKSYDGVVVHEKNAVAIEPTDSDALSRALIRILGEPVFAEGIRDEGLRTVSEKGDFRKEMSGLIHTYRVLLGERKAA